MIIPNLYFGNLTADLAQYKSGAFYGLALTPMSEKDLVHDAREPLPFADNSVPGMQSEDVFEHIEKDKIPVIFNEIYRCLQVGGVFRLSMPDYNSPLLRNRSVYDSEGNILCDLSVGSTVTAPFSGSVQVSHPADGNTHLWFPTYVQLLELIIQSEIRKSAQINVHHAWVDKHRYICQAFDHSVMPVSRVPPNDMRAHGTPISMVVDFVK